MLWRVGDGKSIKISGDHWIPSPSLYIVQSPVSILPPNAKVNALIDVDTHWWDVRLVHEIFMSEEAEKICRVVICPARMEDKLE